ncbi:hypothetical protein, partial [Streptomyces sp. NPDC056132]|uniref:hypothetical protein n=1 Tax=Streptomyces sp. NPDC056132 TaxID=3345722 RepID=UPI0035DBB337
STGIRAFDVVAVVTQDATMASFIFRGSGSLRVVACEAPLFSAWGVSACSAGPSRGVALASP